MYLNTVVITSFYMYIEIIHCHVILIMSTIILLL